MTGVAMPEVGAIFDAHFLGLFWTPDSGVATVLAMYPTTPSPFKYEPSDSVGHVFIDND
jgi:hypothetical protein